MPLSGDAKKGIYEKLLRDNGIEVAAEIKIIRERLLTSLGQDQASGISTDQVINRIIDTAGTLEQKGQEALDSEEVECAMRFFFRDKALIARRDNRRIDQIKITGNNDDFSDIRGVVEEFARRGYPKIPPFLVFNHIIKGANGKMAACPLVIDCRDPQKTIICHTSGKDSNLEAVIRGQFSSMFSEIRFNTSLEEKKTEDKRVLTKSLGKVFYDIISISDRIDNKSGIRSVIGNDNDGVRVDGKARDQDYYESIRLRISTAATIVKFLGFDHNLFSSAAAKVSIPPIPPVLTVPVNSPPGAPLAPPPSPIHFSSPPFLGAPSAPPISPIPGANGGLATGGLLRPKPLAAAPRPMPAQNPPAIAAPGGSNQSQLLAEANSSPIVAGAIPPQQLAGENKFTLGRGVLKAHIQAGALVSDKTRFVIIPQNLQTVVDDGNRRAAAQIAKLGLARQNNCFHHAEFGGVIFDERNKAAGLFFDESKEPWQANFRNVGFLDVDFSRLSKETLLSLSFGKGVEFSGCKFPVGFQGFNKSQFRDTISNGAPINPSSSVRVTSCRPAMGAVASSALGVVGP